MSPDDDVLRAATLLAGVPALAEACAEFLSDGFGRMRAEDRATMASLLGRGAVVPVVVLELDLGTARFELEALRRRERERYLEKGDELPAIVFASDTGGYLDVGNVRRAFYRILTGAGLRHIRFHDLRHTFASLLIQQGESLAYVRDQMGHASIQITVDTYGHLVRGGRLAGRCGATVCNPGATGGGVRGRGMAASCWWAARGSNPGHPD